MPSTGQTRTTSGGTKEWYWNGNWHTVAPPAPAPSSGGVTWQTLADNTAAGINNYVKSNDPGFAALTGQTPAPAPAPDPSPFDAAYQNQLDLNRRNLADTLSGLDVQRGQTVRSFGLDDSNDPYARAALLKKAFQQRQLTTTNSMAARGQQNSGAYGTEQRAGLSDYNQSYDSLRKQYDQILATIAAKRAQAIRDAAQSDINATSTHITNSLSAG